MEGALWFFVVLGSSLILQSLASGQVSNTNEVQGHVQFFPPQNIDFQRVLQHYTIKPEYNMKDDLMRQQKSFTDKTLFVVTCVKDISIATVFVYAPEGYLIERVKNVNKDDCDNDKYKDHIAIIDEPKREKNFPLNGYEQLEFTIIYTFGEKTLRCVSRLYKYVTKPIKFQYYDILQRSEPQLIDCRKKTETKEAIVSRVQRMLRLGDSEQASQKHKVSISIQHEKNRMLPKGDYEIMDLIKDADSVDAPSIITLKADSNIKLKCRQYTKKGTSLAVGYITYENLILARLFLDSCPVGKVEGIYINRRPHPIVNEFTLVYKTTDGHCFKITIKYQCPEPCEDIVSMNRSDNRQVNCPEDWNSDAAFEVTPTD
ncbi:uncharacterized protein LOC128994607 isoform X2 [Macrosteles quadrilineatus]|uniref:uncharacterized protein LOC128994607 isoform X2 n=1 Tax=Macrosteles quadrilineatus TaxID=74068 RepID=UPI0023E0E3A8|nr:uncharacterized protein LOC128994607 isoform X2 [Macrosteles quadrilineatus]